MKGCNYYDIILSFSFLHKHKAWPLGAKWIFCQNRISVLFDKEGKKLYNVGPQYTSPEVVAMSFRNFYWDTRQHVLHVLTDVYDPISESNLRKFSIPRLGCVRCILVYWHTFGCRRAFYHTPTYSRCQGQCLFPFLIKIYKVKDILYVSVTISNKDQSPLHSPKPNGRTKTLGTS